VTYARPVTPELYAELMADLEELKANRNPWASSWLQILATLEDEANRTAVLAALINGLPALYQQMHALGIAALKTIGRLATLEDDLSPLEEVFVGPKPPSVPDHLGALFAPLAEPNIAGPKYAPAIADEDTAELMADGGIAGLKPDAVIIDELTDGPADKYQTELRRVRHNVRDRVLSADAMLDAILTDAEEEE